MCEIFKACGLFSIWWSLPTSAVNLSPRSLLKGVTFMAGGVLTWVGEGSLDVSMVKPSGVMILDKPE